MNKLKKIIALFLTGVMAASLLSSCSSSNKSSSGGSSNSQKVTLTYAIWDKNQLPGMKAIADEFTKENPNIKVDVQVTAWNQYWIKMEAAGAGGSLPDVFWMHSNNFLTFASSNKLMDLTSKISSSSTVKNSNFPDDLIKLYTYNSKQYAVPKDYDTIGLWYNKTLFDQKGIKYPDSSWDWNKLKSVAKQLTDTSKGVYGFLSYPNTQNIIYDLIYQNGGYPISDDRTKSGYSSAESVAAIKYALSFAQDKTSPTAAQFTNTTAEQYFESGKGAMLFDGSWYTSEFYSNDYVKKNCDVAVLPHGTKQATIYNGLGNSISATTKYPNEAWKFEEFLGSKKANEIQSEYGSAIPAYKGLSDGWVKHFSGFNAKAFPEMLNSSVLYANNWKGMESFGTEETTLINEIYSNKVSVEQGCQQLASKMNEKIESSK